MIDNRQTNNRVGSEWYTCTRCGFNYPRALMVNQNGMDLCIGSPTNNCGGDIPGHSANFRLLDIPYETRPEPLPDESVEL